MIVCLLVEDEAWSAIPDLEAKAQDAVRRAWRSAGRGDAEGEVSVLLTGDDEVAELNALWRGKSGPTNVLSFPASNAVPPDAPRLLGDIALAYGIVAREARDQGKSLESHAIHLILHGALHLLGHDHLNEAEAWAMERVEIDILAGLGIPNPYLERNERL